MERVHGRVSASSTLSLGAALTFNRGGAHYSPLGSGGPLGRDPERHLTVMLIKYDGELGDLRNKPIEWVEEVVLQFKRLHVPF